MTTTYSEMTKACGEAIRGDIKTINQWKGAANKVSDFYGSEVAIKEVKAQFIADAVLPFVDKRHAAALAVDLPRKGSKEYNALDESGRAKWADDNDAKIKARATCDTYFTRIVKYAFPPAKTVKDTPEDNSANAKDAKILADLIARIQKGEARNYHVADVVRILTDAQRVMATPLNK